MRSDLFIELPTLNEEWIEDKFGELLTEATDFFDTVEPQSLEFSIGALGFADAFRNMSWQKRERFFMSDYELEAEENSRRHIENILKSSGIWEKKVCTVADIETYNEAIKEIIFQICDNIALAYAKYLKLSTYEDEA